MINQALKATNYVRFSLAKVIDFSYQERNFVIRKVNGENLKRYVWIGSDSQELQTSIL